MEIKVTYIGLEDRQIKITENEALGYRMLHDDFDMVCSQCGGALEIVQPSTLKCTAEGCDWQGELKGTMTFTDVMPLMPPIVIIPDSPDVVLLKEYLSDPHSGLPDLEEAFQALARLYLGL